MKKIAVLLLLAAFFLTSCSSVKDADENKQSDEKNMSEEKKPEEKPEEKPEDKAVKTEADSAISKLVNKAELLSIPKYEAPKYHFKNVEYSVKPDLSNIYNLKNFYNNDFKFLPGEEEKLAKQMFFIRPGVASKENYRYGQMFEIYDDNDYKEYTNLVTVDSVLNAFHVFYDQLLRKTEEGYLMPAMKRFTEELLKSAVKNYPSLSDDMKTYEEENIALYLCAANLADIKVDYKDIPQSSKDIYEKEIAAIKAEKKAESVILGRDFDYSQFKARGHYTRTEALKKYFTLMSLYGGFGFNLKDSNKVINTLLISNDILRSEKAFKEWSSVYDVSSYMVGKSDDLNMVDVFDAVKNLGFDKPELYKQNMDAIIKALNENTKEQRIVAVIRNNREEKKEFRIMGQRFTPDAHIMTNLIDSYKRPFPSALDVFAVLGSNEAKEILYKDMRVNEVFPDYEMRFKKMENLYSENEGIFFENAYTNWLGAIKDLAKTNSDRPAFMLEEKYAIKKLISAAASYAQLKHDTVLYGKAVMAEMGDGGEMEPEIPILGYVEPEPELYSRLKYNLLNMKENLSRRGYLNKSSKEKIESFVDMLRKLEDISIKELEGTKLTEDEYEYIQWFGGSLEYIMISIVDDNVRNWYEISNDTDKYIMTVADIASADPGVLNEAVGPSAEIYAAVPIEGKVYLARGAIFDYYEFVSEKRLSDEEWIKIIKEHRQPQRPEWAEKLFK